MIALHSFPPILLSDHSLPDFPKVDVFADRNVTDFWRLHTAKLIPYSFHQNHQYFELLDKMSLALVLPPHLGYESETTNTYKLVLHISDIFHPLTAFSCLLSFVLYC